MTEHDKKLMDLVVSHKGNGRYSIIVDNDAVWVQDNQRKADEEDGYWTAFDEYGYHLIRSIFEYLGIDSEYV